MPDIALPVLVTGNPVAPVDISGALYSPAAAPESYEVMDGWLDNANRDTGTPWDVDWTHVRHGSLSRGGAVGVTSNTDYFPFFFPQGVADPSAYVALPGAGLEFYLPSTATRVFFTWSITEANSIENLGLYPMFARLVVDGVVRKTIPWPNEVFAGNWREYRGRVWAAHWSTSGLARGHHSAYIEVFMTGDAPNIPFAAATDVMAQRFRVRNFNYFAVV